MTSMVRYTQEGGHLYLGNKQESSNQKSFLNRKKSMFGTLNLAKSLWLVSSWTLEHTTATILNQCNSQLHSQYLFPNLRMSVALTPLYAASCCSRQRPSQKSTTLQNTENHLHYTTTPKPQRTLQKRGSNTVRTRRPGHLSQDVAFHM